ncbi:MULTISPECIES: VOC family protein [unclassified Nocardioides]|uniref:VOC family protein n=1 Tax=unclassified Nocardioides TaxID=2615069 RepID=UPI0006FBFA2A|nr:MULTISPECIES: VOC family protein [unclassified Nocardioides]KRA39001.1 glyoxalase [Nocardioides sp. Root614]KRA92960.1 glyoxalase [Nocardioides sp. Root682]
MHVTSTAISLNVPDVATSASFAIDHFGFTEAMAADGFVSLEHPSAGVNVIFLRTGLETFRPPEVAGSAGQGLLLVFVVEDLDEQFARIAAAGARVVTPPETEPWGERYCQFADGNGLVWQLVQWMVTP